MFVVLLYTSIRREGGWGGTYVLKHDTWGSHVFATTERGVLFCFHITKFFSPSTVAYAAVVTPDSRLIFFLADNFRAI